jgi:hypothetical protein
MNSPVEDTERSSRPSSVSKAVVMLYVALGLEMLRTAVGMSQMAAEHRAYTLSSIFLGPVPIFAGLGMLYFFIGRGGNWARLVAVAVTALFIASQVKPFLNSVPEIPFVGILAIGQTALQLWALVLLFKPEAAAWFRRPAKQH